MADANVNYQDLIRFKSVLERNRAQFGEMRQSLGSQLRNLTSTEWQDPVSQNFETVFTDSERDIQNLEQIMNEFELYLNGKIEILQRYHSHKL
ncbi:MAG: hypothetical protein LBQ01_02820 [Prevotellaceae bacterium]|jgi:hypothetical protein|nr:hypothetical protein [Prevotellaceae bacterium]